MIIRGWNSYAVVPGKEQEISYIGLLPGVQADGWQETSMMRVLGQVPGMAYGKASAVLLTGLPAAFCRAGLFFCFVF